MHLAYIRPPSKSSYNDGDVREDNLITYLSGFLASVPNLCYRETVYDFHLDRSLGRDQLLACEADLYILSVRESASIPHYALRIASTLVAANKRVILYGQIGRLKNHPVVAKLGVELVIHDEQTMLTHIWPKFETNRDSSFESGGYVPRPYFQKIGLDDKRRRRLRASVETTRGCEFKCNFCFINNGKNHVKRWSIRNIENVVEDFRVYYDLGFRMFNVMDSEFFGADAALFPQRKQLLESLYRNFPDIKMMIYARADTVSRTGYVSKLRALNVSSIFVGVESFSDPELRALRKGTTGDNLLRSLFELLDSDISIYLSFITFNRGTTVETLRENIGYLRKLYTHPKNSLLGMPNYIFNVETSWKGDGDYEFSPQTYIRWVQYYKEPPNLTKAVYDTSLEPLMEVFRALHYEITKKARDLNYILDQPDGSELYRWYQSLGLFSLYAMELFLDRFSSKGLTINSVLVNLEYMFSLVTHYYERTLPAEHIDLVTAEETLKMMYADVYEVPYLDHGWDNEFAPISVEVKSFEQ